MEAANDYTKRFPAEFYQMPNYQQDVGIFDNAIKRSLAQEDLYNTPVSQMGDFRQVMSQPLYDEGSMLGGTAAQGMMKDAYNMRNASVKQLVDAMEADVKNRMAPSSIVHNLVKAKSEAADVGKKQAETRKISNESNPLFAGAQEYEKSRGKAVGEFAAGQDIINLLPEEMRNRPVAPELKAMGINNIAELYMLAGKGGPELLKAAIEAQARTGAAGIGAGGNVTAAHILAASNVINHGLQSRRDEINGLRKENEGMRVTSMMQTPEGEAARTKIQQNASRIQQLTAESNNLRSSLGSLGKTAMGRAGVSTDTGGGGASAPAASGGRSITVQGKTYKTEMVKDKKTGQMVEAVNINGQYRRVQ